MRGSRARWWGCCCVVGVLLASGAEGAETGLSGLWFEPPEGWILEDPSTLRRALAARAPSADAESVVSVWREPAGRGRLVFARRPCPVPVADLDAATARALVEDALSERRERGEVVVRHVARTKVSGVPALCLRLGVRSGERHLEQRLFVISGRETYLLGLSCPAGRYPEVAGALETLLESASVPARRPGLPGGSVWLWGGIGAGLLGGGLRWGPGRERLAGSPS